MKPISFDDIQVVVSTKIEIFDYGTVISKFSKPDEIERYAKGLLGVPNTSLTVKSVVRIKLETLP